MVTPPKDQGTCGSCWAFASAAYAESKLIRDGKYNNTIDLSEQFVLRCTTESDCNGGYMEYAMQTAKTMPLEEDYTYDPYRSDNGICFAGGIYVASQNFDYYDLTDQEIIDLLQTGPVGASIASEGWTNYGSGVFSCASTVVVDHAILIIGYTADEWLIKNQWGTSWGENGYMRLTRDRTNRANCLVGTSIHVMWEKSMSFIWLAIMLALMILA